MSYPVPSSTLKWIYGRGFGVLLEEIEAVLCITPGQEILIVEKGDFQHFTFMDEFVNGLSFLEDLAPMMTPLSLRVLDIFFRPSCACNLEQEFLLSFGLFLCFCYTWMLVFGCFS